MQNVKRKFFYGELMTFAKIELNISHKNLPSAHEIWIDCTRAVCLAYQCRCSHNYVKQRDVSVCHIKPCDAIIFI